MKNQSISLLICALGGEGGGVLTEWLVDIARHAGYPAQATSIPGVAQRTGATTYYIEVFPVPMAELGGKRPVFSLNPVPGALDAMVSSELLETARQVGNGLPSPERTLVITSSARTLTTQERMHLGDGRADDADLLKLVRQFSRSHQVFDMAAVARETGTVVSAVMLGAIAGSGLFPFRRADYEAIVKEGGKGVEASLRGFAKAFDIVSQGKAQATSSPRCCSPAGPRRHAGAASVAAAPREHLSGLRAGDVRPGLRATARIPGPDYAELYVQRLRQVLAAEREADPQAAHGHADHARDGALAGAVDGVRRHRARRRPEEPGLALDARQGRGEAGRRRPAEAVRPLQAGRAGVCRAAAPVAGAQARGLGPQARGEGQAALGAAAEDRHPQRVRHAFAAHSRPLKWLRVRGSRYALEQQMIESGCRAWCAAPSAAGSSATRSRCAAA
jgi:indolepyruvate ferredoxin oxidoreductase beta subunit